MNSITTLRNCCQALIESGEYSGIQCIAVLDWKSIPESSKQIKSVVVPSGRITEYLHNTVRIVQVQPYGYFQII